MMTIETYVSPSKIHGQGLYTANAIRKGEVVWRHDPVFTKFLTDQEVAALPEILQRFMYFYGYRFAPAGQEAGMYLDLDNSRFMNHSETPNTAMHPENHQEYIALQDIPAHGELTCDYSEFEPDFRLVETPKR